jgi:lipopolysaccharide/colanic/teichoic acid biosynthesis glycosyltransferase
MAMDRSNVAEGDAMDRGRLARRPDRPPGVDVAAVRSVEARPVAPMGPAAAALKRGLDIAVALGVLAASAPLMGILAVLIKRESQGPAIFSQWRLGQDCRPFRFYKFRTMYADWPTRFPELAGFNFDKDRMEQVYLHRRTSLDELPNFWNILVGQMSLVGPRPELPDMLPYYPTRDKFAVKPGLTCWAQIRGRGELNFPDTLAMDLEYVRTRSLRIDVRILAETVKAVVTGRGAY